MAAAGNLEQISKAGNLEQISKAGNLAQMGYQSYNLNANSKEFNVNQNTTQCTFDVKSSSTFDVSIMDSAIIKPTETIIVNTNLNSNLKISDKFLAYICTNKYTFKQRGITVYNNPSRVESNKKDGFLQIYISNVSKFVCKLNPGDIIATMIFIKESFEHAEKRGSDVAAGCLAVAKSKSVVSIYPKLYPIPEDHFGIIFNNMEGLHIINAPIIVQNKEPYEVIIYNSSDADIQIEKETIIAKLAFVKTPDLIIIE